MFYMRSLKLTILFLVGGFCFGQLRQYELHIRGMLHETLFNTGEIGRAYHQGQAGQRTSVPLMEWPAPSWTVVDGVEYDGHHNTLGGGIWISADAPDTSVRMFAFCGASGASQPEVVVGKWSFPYSIYRVENYPVLPNGDLNPNYDPDEAEEIIYAKWGTPLGITVTRVSRAWSYPDYNDFIIYEYELENTGDRDGNPLTIESTETLYDVLVAFAYGFAPSMFAYQRKYNRWYYQDFERTNQRARFDRDRWLCYNLTVDGMPDPKYYDQWGRSGENGGGLTAPQAVGFMVLYYDSDHLAKYGETRAVISSSDSVIVWDENGRIKQPWINRVETSNLRATKIQEQLVVNPRKNPPYRNIDVFGPDWVGRGSFNHRQTRKAVGRFIVFGPYTLRHGDKIRFAIAELAGYGAARLEETRAGLRDEGGSCGEDCGEPADSAFYPVPNWWETIAYGGPSGSAFTYGSTYLSNYPVPSFVDSEVMTIREVADKAKEAYTGDSSPPPYWPDKFPSKGVYKIPVPVPAPAIEVYSNSRGWNIIEWGPQVESFRHPRLQGEFSHYEVYKSKHPLGPWEMLVRVDKKDLRFFDGNRYKIIDSTVKVGEVYYYSVLSVDVNGKKSGRTNITKHETQIGAADKLTKVYVVPNPLIVKSGFSGGGEANLRIGFYNLPKECTIRIYSYSGQLINTIEHRAGTYSVAWYQVSRNNQLIAPGTYFFIVETPSGERTMGKFAIRR